MWPKNENSETEVRKMHYVQKIYYTSIMMLISYSVLIIYLEDLSSRAHKKFSLKNHLKKRGISLMV